VPAADPEPEGEAVGVDDAKGLALLGAEGVRLEVGDASPVEDMEVVPLAVVVTDTEEEPDGEAEPDGSAVDDAVRVAEVELLDDEEPVERLDAEAVGLPVAAALGEDAGDCEPVDVGEGEYVGDAETDEVGVGSPEPDGEGLPDALEEAVGVVVAVTVAEGLPETVGEPEGLPEDESIEVREPLPVGELDSDCSLDALPVTDAEEDGDCDWPEDAVEVLDGVPLVDGESDGDAEGVAEVLREEEPLGVAVADAAPEADGDADPLDDTEAEAVGDGRAEAVVEALADAVPVAVAVPDGESVRDELEDAVWELEMLPEGD
jgi:hypothetical protein